MSQVALLIGIKNGKRALIAEGDPRAIRHRFKHASTGEGFDVLEVFESTVGRSRHRSFIKKQNTPVLAPHTVVTPDVEPGSETVADPDDTEALINLANGDGRRAEVREARMKLDELGIAY